MFRFRSSFVLREMAGTVGAMLTRVLMLQHDQQTESVEAQLARFVKHLALAVILSSIGLTVLDRSKCSPLGSRPHYPCAGCASL